MEDKKNKKIILLGILFLIFPPHLIFFGYYFKSVYISVLIPGILGFIFFIRTNKLNKLTIYTLYVLIIQFAYFYLNYEFNIYKDNSILIRHYQGFICFFAAFFYIYIIKINKLDIYKIDKNIIFDLIIYSTFINSVVLILTIFSPSFKEILYQYIGITDLARQYMFNFKEIGRYQGIVHSGFSFLSTIYGIVISINILLLYSGITKKYLIPLIINFIALVNIGRSGYIPIIFTLLYLTLVFFAKGNKINIASMIKLFLISILIILYILIFAKDIYWIIEPFNFFRYDQSTIGNLLSHKISYPDNIIFGNGNFGVSPNFPNLMTDMGFEIFLNASGIIGYFIAYILIIPVLLLWKDKSLSFNLKSIFLIFIFSYAILNFKDYYYYGYGDIFQVYFLLVFSSLLTSCNDSNPFYYKNIYRFLTLFR
jgi:hypothetical protein